MNEQANLPDRPGCIAHPAWVAVSVVFGLLLLWPGSGSWDADAERSIMLGFAVGLPGILAQKLVLRKTVDFYAAFYLTPVFDRVFGRQQGRNMLYVLPFQLTMMGFVVLRLAFGIRSDAGWGVIFVLSALCYPECKAIYRAAWAKIEEMRQEAARNQ